MQKINLPPLLNLYDLLDPLFDELELDYLDEDDKRDMKDGFQKDLEEEIMFEIIDKVPKEFHLSVSDMQEHEIMDLLKDYHIDLPALIDMKIQDFFEGLYNSK